MKQSVRHIAILAAATLALAACNKPDDKAEGTATAGAESAEGSASSVKIPGLEGDKAQAGYVIGLDIAKSLEPAKGEYDVEAMIKGLKAGVAGEKALVDDKRVALVSATGSTRMGRAVAFRNTDDAGRPDPDSLHAGTPVLAGEKWLATLWFRERRYRAF